MLASRLEDDSMSYDVFSPFLYYANLAPASGEDLLEIAQSSQSTGHEHLMLQSITYCSPQPLAGSQRHLQLLKAIAVAQKDLLLSLQLPLPVETIHLHPLPTEALARPDRHYETVTWAPDTAPVAPVTPSQN